MYDEEMTITGTLRKGKRRPELAQENQENEFDSDIENTPKSMMDDDEDSSEMDVEDSNLEDEEDDDDDDSDAESIDSAIFKEKIIALTDEARQIGKEIDETNTKEKDLDLTRNCSEGQDLAGYIGASPTKGISSLTHVTALAETALTKARKIGATCNIFSQATYLRILQARCRTDGEYDPSKLSHLMGQHYMSCSRAGYTGMSTMVGMVDFSTEDPEEVQPEKVRRAGKPKFEKNLTQHQVVNNTGRETGMTDEQRSLDASRLNAKKVEKICKQKGIRCLPLLNFGLAGAAGPHEFVQNVFDMAVAARDGYAAVERDTQNDTESPESQNELSQLSIKAATPPMTESGEIEVVRQQQIVSFKAKDIKEFFARMQLQQQQHHQQSASDTDESD